VPLANTDHHDQRAAFTIVEAAERLTISRSSLYRLIGRNQIRVVKIGHRSVIPAEEISRLLEEGTDNA
jgi:excisionase family DNA binding protein